MAMEQGNEKDAEVPHIGAAPHRGRNLGIVGALVALAVLIGVYQISGSRSDAQELGRLNAFLSVYAQKCDERLAGPPSSMISHVYLHSAAVQAAVETQLKALNTDGNCAKVYTALHAADFPLPRLPTN